MRYVLAFSVAAGLLFGSAVPAEAKWAKAWSTSIQGLYTLASAISPTNESPSGLSGQLANNQSFRMIVRPTLSGSRVRVLLSNRFSNQPLAVGRATVARPTSGASVDPRTVRQLSFGGTPEITIPPGGAARSDPVPLRAHARHDLAVSFWTKGTGTPIPWHRLAYATSYLTAPFSGDHVDEADGASFSYTTRSWMFLSGVEVEKRSVPGLVVVFGDSITDGGGSAFGQHNRWVDVLAARLGARRPEARYGVLNAGIGGNSFGGFRAGGLRPCEGCTGPPALERLGPDALEQRGVTDALVLLGSNDLSTRGGAAVVIGGLAEIARRFRAAGIRPLVATILPRDATFRPVFDQARRKVNTWIRTQGSYDGVVDFEKVVQDPNRPDRFRPDYSADGVHPNSAGHAAMGRAVSLRLFSPPGDSGDPRGP